MPPVPANEKTIAMYAACLARRLRPASVRQYLNIVRVMHLEAGLSNPLKDSWFISSALKCVCVCVCVCGCVCVCVCVCVCECVCLCGWVGGWV